ncbi:hypothetical protein [Microcystis phage Mvi-JY20]|uniref:Uncharacterized protein n=1 Tax=Microcystis phage Mvi-JY20 TaxID=3128146 RepID=A0AAX4QGZ6_9CAUD
MTQPRPKNLATREFVLWAIEAMFAAIKTKTYVMSNNFWATRWDGKSLELFGLGGINDESNWSEEERLAVSWCCAVSRADWYRCASLGHPVPESAMQFWCIPMGYASNPYFFSCWKRFANALPSESEHNEKTAN